MLSPHASARLYEAISHFSEHTGGSSNAPNIPSCNLNPSQALVDGTATQATTKPKIQ